MRFHQPKANGLNERSNSMSDASEPSNRFSKDQGRILLRLARQTIAAEIGPPPPEQEAASLAEALAENAFAAHRGVFVTLKLAGALRGCIGSLTAREPLVDNVRHNAAHAAFHDPRFSPLTAAELSGVSIEVSILSTPAPLAYADPPDLLAKLRPGTDGVILRKGQASATFLPQVWEQLPRPEDFLSQLCLKAGLPPNEWRQSKLEIETYLVQSFEERDDAVRHDCVPNNQRKG